MVHVLSDVEYCRMLMNSPKVKPQLDAIVRWYEEKLKREREAQFTDAGLVVEA